MNMFEKARTSKRIKSNLAFLATGIVSYCVGTAAYSLVDKDDAPKPHVQTVAERADSEADRLSKVLSVQTIGRNTLRAQVVTVLDGTINIKGADDKCTNPLILATGDGSGYISPTGNELVGSYLGVVDAEASTNGIVIKAVRFDNETMTATLPEQPGTSLESASHHLAVSVTAYGNSGPKLDDGYALSAFDPAGSVVTASNVAGCKVTENF